MTRSIAILAVCTPTFQVGVRCILLSITCALVTTSPAQTGIVSPWNFFGQELKSKGVWSPPDQANPLQPTGFPGLEPREGDLPPAAPEGEDQRVLRIFGDPLMSRRGSRITIEGGVHVQYRGYDIFGDKLIGDTTTEIFTLFGHVKVIGLDAIIGGQKVTVNFKEKSFIAENADSQLRPEFFERRVLQDVYTRAMKSYGTENQIFGEDERLTTCNLDHPHFEILARSSDLRPGKRIVLKGVEFKLFNRRIIRIPYLSIPLEERDDRYLPEVGQSRDEGFYIKSKFGIPLKGPNYLDTNLDYFTKLGLGLGGTYAYDSLSSKGMLKAYGLIGPSKTVTVNQQHRGRFAGIDIDIANNLQKSTYFNSPENTIFDTRIGLGFGGTRLNITRNRNDSSGFAYQNESVSLSDNRNLTPRTKLQTDLTLSKNLSESTSSNTKREQIDVRIRGQHDLRKATALFEYQRSIPVGEVSNFYGSADRTPVFTLQSDSQRLMGQNWNTILPFQTELSMGEFFDPGTKSRVTRGNFDFNFNRPDASQERFGFDLNNRFRQSWYSDDTAQYVVNTNVGARYSLGSRESINLRYSFLRGYGFSPLQFDRTGQSNFLSFDASYAPLRTLTLAAQTGYDFIQEQQQGTAWQNLGLRADWNPAKWFQFRSLATYDTFERAWSNVRMDLAWKAGGTFVGAGARYDGFRHTWGSVNLFVDGFQAGRLRTSFLAAYNGYLRQFETRQFSFIYDLHCAEAILEIRDDPLGFRPGTTVSFFLRLKAFPFETPFGVNRRGAAIGLGTGRDGF